MSTVQTFDFSANLLRALLWRHNAAVNLQAILQDKQDFYDLNTVDFWNDWFTNVFDLRTADEFGLQVWARILGLTITINNDPQPANTAWGFGTFRINYFGANFSSSGGDIVLTTDDARRVLRIRYYQLTTNGNVVSINGMIADVFGDLGTGHVLDNNDMTMEYVFNFTLSNSLEQLLNDIDILPRPAGVSITITDI